MASFISTVSAPPTPRSSAVIGSPARLVPMTMRPRRSRMSREARGERENRHDLAGDRDVEAGDARQALFLGPLADGDLAQHAVVGIDHAAPGDAVGIDIQTREAAALLGRQLVGIGLCRCRAFSGGAA